MNSLKPHFVFDVDIDDEHDGATVYSSSQALQSASLNTGKLSCSTEDHTGPGTCTVQSDSSPFADTVDHISLLAQQTAIEDQIEAEDIDDADLLDLEVDSSKLMEESLVSSGTKQPMLDSSSPVNGKSTSRSTPFSSSVSTIEGRPPIVRKPFPDLVLDRSPVFGLSTAPVLRTCFRIGEALNIGCDAARNNRNIVLELFARLESTGSSSDGGRGRTFTFGDLYHFRPPKLTAVEIPCKEDALWKRFDGEILKGMQSASLICRCLGRMKRHKDTWQFELTLVRPSTWQEIERTREVVCA